MSRFIASFAPAISEIACWAVPIVFTIGGFVGCFMAVREGPGAALLGAIFGAVVAFMLGLLAAVPFAVAAVLIRCVMQMTDDIRVIRNIATAQVTAQRSGDRS
jgi:hypothetical protein